MQFIAVERNVENVKDLEKLCLFYRFIEKDSF